MCKFFFFQAEDGRRYGTVTGVQTCALPISRWLPGCPPLPEGNRELRIEDRRSILDPRSSILNSRFPSGRGGQPGSQRVLGVVPADGGPLRPGRDRKSVV